MDINTYFNEVQEEIKKKIEDKSQLDIIIKEMEENNLQAIINQEFNNDTSIEECVEIILSNYNKQVDDNNAPKTIEGERVLNTMERKVMNYNQFIKLN